jgi:hypothetical protein
MLRQHIWIFGLAAALAACGRSADTGGDVLGQSKGTVIYATTECVSPHPDGVQCNKKTCKTDAESDCSDFASKCLSNDHHYSGTNDGGTCSRVL